MLRHIDRRAAVFTAERQTLEQAQKHENHGRRQTDLRIAGKKSNRRCRAAHYQERDEEREFPPHEIADSPEYERAERTYREAYGESRECFEKIRGWISR